MRSVIMSKNFVTVIGERNSGKTMYLLGMYEALSGSGLNGFTLYLDDDEKDLYMRELLERLSEEGEKPQTTNQSESYDFHVAYGLRSLLNFTWQDYPGDWIFSQAEYNSHSDMKGIVENSSCILFIVDGQALCKVVQKTFNGMKVSGRGGENEEDDWCLDSEESLIIKAIKKAKDKLAKPFIPLRTLCNEKGEVPCVGVVFTKSDAIVDFLCKNDKGRIKYSEEKCKEIYFKFVSKVFISIAEGSLLLDRFVFPMSVSIGREIDGGFCMMPDCVEQPVTFAVLNILVAAATKIKNDIRCNRKNLIDTDGMFKSWWYDNERKEWEKNISSLQNELNKCIRNAMSAVTTVFPSCAYGYTKSDKRGVETIPIGEYFKRKFEEIR